jgi:hypothetical protein
MQSPFNQDSTQRNGSAQYLARRCAYIKHKILKIMKEVQYNSEIKLATYTKLKDPAELTEK